MELHEPKENVQSAALTPHSADRQFHEAFYARVNVERVPEIFSRGGVRFRFCSHLVLKLESILGRSLSD